jgi:geranylgeranylglycerol-phosphate geranylgeranyltransferase
MQSFTKPQFSGKGGFCYRPPQETIYSQLQIANSRKKLITLAVASPRPNWPQPLLPRATAATSVRISSPPSSDIISTPSETELSEMWRMARPINFLPSYLLVLVGAWAALGNAALLSAKVFIMGGLSTAIAGASCLINDYFDAEVDLINAPAKPLPSGRVSPEHALFFAAGSYITVLLIACLLPDAKMRLIVAASAAITLLYSPFLKRISLVKNAAVAATIAAAPLAGALAAGAAGAHLRATLVPCGFLFLAVCYREILMDIQDVEGDAAAGFKTLPVLFGRDRALSLGLGLLTASLALIVFTALHGHGLSWLWLTAPQLEPLFRTSLALGGCAVILRPMAAAVKLWKRNFPEKDVGIAIDETLKTVGMGMILLAAMV